MRDHAIPSAMVMLSPQISLFQAGCYAPISVAPKLAIAQIPSTAFGDGSHPTTLLCAGAVDVLCRTQSIEAFLDVGTGTGVLARIARQRGVKWVIGTDIDSLALHAARQNAELDIGTIPIDFQNTQPDHWGARFDLIVANILEGPLRDLAPALALALAPGGQLLLSGFTRLQTPGLCLLYEGLGLRLLSESEQQGWALLHFQRSRHP